MISVGEFGKALEILPDIDNEFDRIDFLCKIQLAELTSKLNVVENLIKQNNFSEAKLELEKLQWKNNTGFELNADGKLKGRWFPEHLKEYDYYEQFFKKKQAIEKELDQSNTKRNKKKK